MRLTPLVLLFALGPWSSHHYSSHAAELAAYSANSSNNVPPAQPCAAALTKPTNQNDSCCCQSQSNQDNLPLYKRPEWISIWVAVIYALLAAGTLWAIWRQGKTANDIQKKTTRPWVLFHGFRIYSFETRESQTGAPHPTRVTYTLKNWGKTPARITASEIRFELSDSPDVPPHPEIYQIDKFNINPHVLPQNDFRESSQKLMPSGWPDSSQVDAYYNMRSFLWVYGIATYEDVHGTKYETRFCFRSADYPLRVRPLALRLDGPPEYNQAT